VSEANRRLERLAFRARPALESVELDGWVLRFAGGYTKRANSVNPHFGSARPSGATQPTKEKITQCEAMYAERGLPTIFRLTPFSQPPQLDRALADAGYRVLDRSVVMTGTIHPIDARLESVEFVAPEAWFGTFDRLRHLDAETAGIHRRIIDSAAGERLFARSEDEAGPIACGLGVCVEDTVALFDLFVEESRRCQGHGTAVAAAILHRAMGGGARSALLQTHSENAVAQRLYARFGLAVAYPYWYRIQEPELR